MITDRRALLEFRPDPAHVLGEFLATLHAGAAANRAMSSAVMLGRTVSALARNCNDYNRYRVSGRDRCSEGLY